MDEFVKVSGKVFYRRGVKIPWLEIEIRYDDKKAPVKIIGRVVEEFLSDSWKKDVEEAFKL